MMATRVGGADRRRTGLALGFRVGADADGRRDVGRLPEVTEEGMVSCSSLMGQRCEAYLVKREAF